MESGCLPSTAATASARGARAPRSDSRSARRRGRGGPLADAGVVDDSLVCRPGHRAEVHDVPDASPRDHRGDPERAGLPVRAIDDARVRNLVVADPVVASAGIYPVRIRAGDLDGEELGAAHAWPEQRMDRG